MIFLIASIRELDNFRSFHPSTWRSYDLRLLRLGIPEDRFSEFLDETFADPGLYAAAPLCDGVAAALNQLRDSGWDLVGITARPPHLAAATTAWLAGHGLPVDKVHHTPVGTKAQVARELGVNEGTLGNWVVKARRARDGGNAALSEDERAELARLRRENAELAMQRDVLIGPVRERCQRHSKIDQLSAAEF